MRLIQEKLGDYAVLTGYLHEIPNEMHNIEAFSSILVLPGGGFRGCSPREMEPIAMAYFAEGYQAFTLKYTTVTDSPKAGIEAPMEDVQQAIAMIREKQDEYLVARNQLAIIGFSGGAHLASAVATHGPLRPDVLLLGYPGILHSKLRAMECPDIIECVDENTPDTFLFSTWNDPVTPPEHSLAFAQALNKAGVECELHIFRSGDHGLSLAKPFTSSGSRNYVNPVVAQWFKLSMDWLNAKFGEFTVYDVQDESLDSSLGKKFFFKE